MNAARSIHYAALTLLVFIVPAANGALPPAAQFNFRDPSRQSLPEWVLGLGQTGGRFTGTPASWTVDASAPPDTGTISIEFDRTAFSEDLAVGVIHTDRAGLRWTAKLLDDSGRVLATDLTTNLVSRSSALQTDTFIVPLSKIRAATKLALCRATGEMNIHGVILQPLPVRLRNDSATQSELTQLFGGATSVNALRQALAKARGEPPPSGSASRVTGTSGAVIIREGPQLIDEPRDGARVQRTIPMSGRAPQVPEGHHLYVFLSMGPDFWPKGEVIIPVDGRWQTVVKHGGHDEASFTLGLYDVNPDAHARFQAWRAEAKRTGKYPPIKDMTGTVRLSGVGVKVLPD